MQYTYSHLISGKETQLPLKSETSQYADKIAGKFLIQEPISHVELRESEGTLPSSKLYTVPFPSSNIPNLFTPSYIQQISHNPYELLPDYRVPRGFIPTPRRKKKKAKYYRRRYY